MTDTERATTWVVGLAEWLPPEMSHDEFAGIAERLASTFAAVRREERTAVVAWIRGRPDYAGTLALDIEAGRHLDAGGRAGS